MLQKINWSAISPDESEKLKNELVEVWEASVRSTHRFLTEKDIRFFKPLIRNKYIPVVELYIIRNGQNRIAAFMGLSDELIEMLFVHPEEQGKGYGKQLIEFAIYHKHIFKVDVNEQNEKATSFYLNRGFDIVGRDETDPNGNPFPILHLSLNETKQSYKFQTVPSKSGKSSAIRNVSSIFCCWPMNRNR